MHSLRRALSKHNGAVTYRERLWPSPWLLIACLLLIPAGVLVFAPINLGAGILAGVGLYALALAFLLGTTPVIEVDSTSLRAGRARLPLDCVGAITPLEGADAVAARGTGLDARAFTLFRGWIPGVIRIENRDESDPAPYWLISTRRPAALATAITAARTPTN